MTKKESTRKALERFFIKEQKRVEREMGVTPKRRRNKKPEKLVEEECLAWMRAQGWQVEIYESKATFDPVRGIWKSQGMKAGTADCMGVTSFGEAVAVEFKAKGRLKTFSVAKNIRQQEFILNRIKTNAFAIVVDSRERLESSYIRWRELKNDSFRLAQDYLLTLVPTRVGGDDDDIEWE